MRTTNPHRAPALLLLAAVAACDPASTGVDLTALGGEESLEWAVLADADAVASAIEVANVDYEVAAASDLPEAPRARSLTVQADAAFADARSAFEAGDRRRAIDSARTARRLLARALIATRGGVAVEDLIGRLEAALLTIDAEVVDDPDALRGELGAIVDDARALVARGDSVDGGARAVLGEQVIRLRRGRVHRAFDVRPVRARLEVALAGEAVALAERAIPDWPVVTDSTGTSVTDRRNRWLARAKRLRGMAERALAGGQLARAVHLAGHAQWSALAAVVLPGGITAEDVERMVDLATTLYEEAEGTVGDDATELRQRVLARAADLLEIGLRRIEAGQRRGIVPLWRSSTLSAWLIS